MSYLHFRGGRLVSKFVSYKNIAMEKFILESDITVFYVTAAFPEGIRDAFMQIGSHVASTGGNYFGISRMEPWGIDYKAAAGECYPGEGEKLGLPTFVIKKGTYASIYVKDFMKDTATIGRAFDELTALPEMAPGAYCVEIYKDDKDVQCIVLLKDETHADLEKALRHEFEELLNMLASLDGEQINTVPFAGSWTPAQLGDHLSRAYNVNELLKSNTAPTTRRIDEKEKLIKDVFLNEKEKYKSPEFIEPSNGKINREKLLADLRNKTENILHFIPDTDLGLTCMFTELPFFGYMTRLEWMYMLQYHTHRHNRQLRNMLKHIPQNA